MDYKNLQLEREMKLGSVLDDSKTTILWDWINPEYATLAIVGDQNRSARKDIVRRIAQNIHQHDEQVVFWITSDQSGMNFEAEVNDSVTWLEAMPDLPIEYDPNQYFRERRGIFPATFFELIVLSIGEFKLREHIPVITYRAHAEGPTHGYKRAFESLDNTKAKASLLQALSEIGNVRWHLTPEGRKFVIPAGVSRYEKAAWMVLAMWNFWAQVCRVDHPQQYLLIIEPDKEVMLGEHESELKNYVFRCLDVMRSMTDEVTMSLLLSLETMFPIPELGIRKRILMQTHESDIDMFTPEHKEFFGDRLYEEWEKGHSYVAYLLDSYTGKSCIVEIHPDQIEFVENKSPIV
jgi:hypothetical protein